MEYREILNFLALCGEKNFTRAAEKRHITQQGLSKSIRRLEEELGAPVFERSRSRVALTGYGRILESAARAWTNQHDYIVDTIRTEAENSRFRLSVGVTDTLLLLFPPRFVASFVEAHPEISLSLATFSRGACQKNVAEQKLQTGIVFGPVDGEQFQAVLLKKTRLIIVAGRRHPLAARESIRLAELEGTDLISMADYFPLEKDAAWRGGPATVSPSILLSFFDLEFAGELLSTGRYASIMLRDGEKTGDIIRQYDLATVRIAEPELQEEIYLIVNRHAFINQAAELFIDYVKKTFAV